MRRIVGRSTVVGTIMDCACCTFHSFARFSVGSLGATLDCGALFLFWPLRWWHTHRFAPPTRMNRPLALLLLWLPVTVWASSDAERSWTALGSLALGIALYLALLNWPPTQRYPCLLVAGIGAIGLALAMTGPALLAQHPNQALHLFG